MRTALVIVDMQHDFVRPQGACCVAGAAATIPIIRQALDTARAQGWPVFHVIREHHPSGTDAERTRAALFAEGRGLALAGSQGAAIVEELQPLPTEYVIKKRRFSAFFQTELDMILRRLGIQTLLITGTQYPNCIRGTAVDAMSHDYDTIVLTDACSAQTDTVAQANIYDLRMMGLTCIPFHDLAATLAARTH